MARQNRSAGIAIFIACITGFIIYAWFLLLSPWKEIVLQLTMLVAVGGLLGVLAWIGLAMATARKSTQNIDKVKHDSEA